MNISRLDYLLDQLKSEGDDPFLFYGIAMEYMTQDRSLALEYLEKCKMRFPDYLPTYYQLALILDERGNSSECMQALEQGISLAKDQNNPKIMGELNNFKTNLDFED